MTASELPTLNACLNAVSAGLLTLGFVRIRRGQIASHRRFMLAALVCSALFLCSYLTYHYLVGSVPYPRHDWTRPVYFAILIPHVVLATLMAPFVLIAVRRAWRGDFVAHARLTRRLLPVWMFVSVSGVAIYLMLYRL